MSKGIQSDSFKCILNIARIFGSNICFFGSGVGFIVNKGNEYQTKNNDLKNNKWSWTGLQRSSPEREALLFNGVCVGSLAAGAGFSICCCHTRAQGARHCGTLQARARVCWTCTRFGYKGYAQTVLLKYERLDTGSGRVASRSVFSFKFIWQLTP